MRKWLTTISWRHFLNWGSFLSDNSGLCQVDTQNKITPNENSNNQKSTPNPQSPHFLFCVCQLLLCIKPVRECGSCSQCHCVGEDLSFPSQQLLITNSFLVRGETLWSLPPLHTGICLVLYWWPQSLWVHTCISHTVSLEIYTTSSSYNPSAFSFV